MTEYQFYALITVILFFKMFAISAVQGLARVSTNTFVTPEDARFFGASIAPDELPIVKRAAMAWRNDLENIPIFLFLAMIYVTLGCSPGGAYHLFLGLYRRADSPHRDVPQRPATVANDLFHLWSSGVLRTRHTNFDCGAVAR